MKNHAAMLCCALAAAACSPPQAGAQEAALEFVTRRGDRLYEGDRLLRFASFNIPNLHLVEDAIDFLGESPWRWPNQYEIDDALETIRQLNGRVVRTYVLSVRRDSSDMGDKVHVTRPGGFNEEAFVVLDHVLKTAAEKRVRVLIPLVDNWRWWGGAEQYAAFRGKPADAFWTDPQLIADFKSTIRYVLNRQNTFTGVRYKDDPALFGWETGNEVDPPAAWTREIAAYIKSIDQNHLVVDGKSLDGVRIESLDDPNVDVITTHHYPGRGEDIPAAVRRAIEQTEGRKPYFVGEVGFLPTTELAEVIDAVADSHAAGVLLWSLRPHRREGGFYWHSEPMAEGRYKAYHWPGFDSGEGYDEREVLRLVRESSFRIRGEALTPPPAPRAPLLLPINDPAAISWRGSTGAAGYNLQRGPAADGPWRTIARGVSDAALPYRPLYHDATAEVGQEHYYRVVATNASGDSPPSNAVGPVRTSARTLVDELADLDLAAKTSGGVRLRTDNPRATQEDPHRAEFAPGAALTYELPGKVERVVVYTFSATGVSPGVHAFDSRGKAIAARVNAASPTRDAGDYGYLRPTRTTATFAGKEARRVVIFLAGDATEPVQVARVDVRHAVTD